MGEYICEEGGLQTTDGKIRFNRWNAREMIVVAGEKLSSAEATILEDAGLLVPEDFANGIDPTVIKPGHRVQWLQTVRDFLATYGYELSTTCTKNIRWATADGRWTFSCMRHNGKRHWTIAPKSGVFAFEEANRSSSAPNRFPTRAKALIWAQEQTVLTYDDLLD